MRRDKARRRGSRGQSAPDLYFIPMWNSQDFLLEQISQAFHLHDNASSRSLTRPPNMRLSALPLLLSSLAFLFILPAAAVFADEAYQVDFHYALLGSAQAQNTFFHRPSTNSKAALIYTLSDKHIVGAVNPKDGSLLWRQRLWEDARNLTTRGLLKAGEGADVVISAIEGVVQAWDAIDGRLVWEHKDEGKVKAVEVVAGTNAEKDVFVAYEVDGVNTRVKRLASDSGEVKWSYEDAR